MFPNTLCSLVEKGVLSGREPIEKEVYSTEETQRFIQCVLKETDMRKRVVFLLYIVNGIRSCEATGLEWKDFDVQNRVIKIQRNSIYTSTFGTKTKGTKSKSSTRILPLDNDMFNLLLDYRIWWEKQKKLHGDLWGTLTDYLLIQTINQCQEQPFHNGLPNLN